MIWFLKLSEVFLGVSFTHFGIYPLTLKSLTGIITMPFIHGDWNHLYSNSFPVFILSTGIIYLYRDAAYKIIAIIWIGAGLLTWITGRPSWHIGASGLIYGFASFLFFSGMIRKDLPMLAVSLIVAFLYGSLIWGIFPLQKHISYEGHLAGAIFGLVCAIAFRKQGPPIQKLSWEIEEEYDGEEEFYQNTTSGQQFYIHYDYKSLEEKEEENKQQNGSTDALD